MSKYINPPHKQIHIKKSFRHHFIFKIQPFVLLDSSSPFIVAFLKIGLSKSYDYHGLITIIPFVLKYNDKILERAEQMT
ncbi:hypothetical protein BpHYR1_012788 [Brachionus plicatilis]|uniref:Uncharacterized protein n=1 Tax=Brachionus plicatilis TaxID=10195 RepID=A0A3M7RM93_BRAPC|nr:hypothetical protein BpHYR1_012788 [Brachionus plicatilis]